MARRVFLHLGTAKSGTTYLQDLWWRHRAALRERGLLLPGEHLRDHFHAAALVKGMDVIVEGLDLRAAPPGACDLVCLPLRIEGADGAPARALIRPLG